MKIHTVGHSNRTLEEFLELLKWAHIRCLVDVRSYPRSRRNPQFNDDRLEDALGARSMDYVHLPALGGRRAAQELEIPSPNDAWSIAGFRNYADYALSAGFREGLEALCDAAARRTTAIMCAERDWRQCHRQIIADHLLARGIEVIHLVSMGERVEATLSRDADIGDDGRVTYPGRQRQLL